MAGSNYGTVENCYSTANVSGRNAGGIVGVAQGSGKTEYCWASGTVTGSNSGYSVGGIVGNKASTHAVNRCVKINGTITIPNGGASNIGRIWGTGTNVTSVNFAWDADSFGWSWNGYLEVTGGTKPTTPLPDPYNKHGRDTTATNLEQLTWWFGSSATEPGFSYTFWINDGTKRPHLSGFTGDYQPY